MPTKMKAARRQKAGEKLARKKVRSDAENTLRTHLTRDGRMKNEDDDHGLVAWLKSLGSHPLEDHRSQWEKDLQERVEAELADAA